MRSRPIYRGAIYLAEKFIRFGICKIKVNACILIHIINNYNFLGESFKNTLLYLYYIFFLIPQVTNVFDITPIFFLSDLNWRPFVSYTPNSNMI